MQMLWCVSCSVVSGSAIPWTVACQALCPWSSPGKNTGLSCHFLLKGFFLKQGSNPGLLQCRQILYHLIQQESPKIWILLYCSVSFCYLSSVLGNFLYFSEYILPRWLSCKESACNAADTGSIPRSERSSGGGNGNSLWHPCLGNPTDRGAWRATVHGVTRVRHDLVTKPTPAASFLSVLIPRDCLSY